MRIWSIHPNYLDSKGIVALWREALLAKNVLEGKTRAYKNHPQLKRFKDSNNPIDCINHYLFFVYEESVKRGYKFDKSKINMDYAPINLKVTKGQLKYEMNHLLKKLKVREPSMYLKLKETKKIENHPIFEVVEGDIEDWEIV